MDDAGRPSLIDSFLAWRDRLIASARFQRRAVANPFTRRIANRRARQLFDLTAGFVYSQILASCVRLDLFAILADGPQSAGQIALRCGLSHEAAERLLQAASALGLVARRSRGRYGLGQLGAALLGNPGVVAMIEHHDMLYRDLEDPVALLKGERWPTEIGQFWAYARDPDKHGIGSDRVGEYSALMAASQQFIAEDVLDSFDVGRFRRLLDIGGGEGAFLTHCARRAPRLEVRLFDLPPVAERARARFETQGLADRAKAIGGDFFADRIPRGADAVSLIRVIYDHDDAFALKVLSRAREAVEPGGTLILAEPMAGTKGAEGVGAYFAFYLLAMGSGRSRRPDELIALVREAGFEDARVVPTRRPMLTGLITARAPRAR